MTLNEMFGNAVWVTGNSDSPAFVLKGKFNICVIKQARLRVAGLGFFNCKINGKAVSEDLYLPLNSDYEPRENYPVDEILSGHRIYVPEYDITNLLKMGDNEITVHFGGGWYTYDDNRGSKYGNPKAIWRVFGDGFDFASSENDEICESYIKDLYVTRREIQDFTTETNWEKTVIANAPDTEYDFSDCPCDRVCEKINPIKIADEIYDCGKNITGYPVLKLNVKAGEKVTVTFSEELSGTELDKNYIHLQIAEFTSDGCDRIVFPEFTWYGFRYFKVEGNAEVLHVDSVHTDLIKISGFKSDNELLNWIHDTYVHTQLTNMHGGVPSDCPHLERRGYTGDGQLTCNAVMNIFDAKAFYKKWIRDIFDGQDKKTGHVQYVVPYFQSGGGPGGWGCAVMEVPYQYYKHYGDTSLLNEAYDRTLKYFEYLDNHSASGLIISDKEGEWCLGEWCTQKSVILPAPFVNNYFYIKTLTRAIEVAKIIGREEYVEKHENKIKQLKKVMTEAYYNKWDGNFFGCVQGANAFAADIGIGDERTYKNLVEYYENLGCFDTGIFGTDIVCRVLFERGNGDLALKLLLSEETVSFYDWKKRGATTFYEYWSGSLRDRSHNHPMFGAVVAYFYDYLLGITENEDKIIIAPVFDAKINEISGFRTLKCGKVSVSYIKKDGKIKIDIDVPEKKDAIFVFSDMAKPLNAGKNSIEIFE